jgi:hypothetical protein
VRQSSPPHLKCKAASPAQVTRVSACLELQPGAGRLAEHRQSAFRLWLPAPTKQPTTTATQTNDQQALHFRPSTANPPNRPTADFVKPARMSRRYDSRVRWSLLQLRCNPSGRNSELGDDEEAYPCRT